MKKNKKYRIEVDSLYNCKFFIVYESDFIGRFNNNINAVGFVTFTDNKGSLVTISPDNCSSVEITEMETMEVEEE